MTILLGSAGLGKTWLFAQLAMIDKNSYFYSCGMPTVKLPKTEELTIIGNHKVIVEDDGRNMLVYFAGACKASELMLLCSMFAGRVSKYTPSFTFGDIYELFPWLRKTAHKTSITLAIATLIGDVEFGAMPTNQNDLLSDISNVLKSGLLLIDSLDCLSTDKPILAKEGVDISKIDQLGIVNRILFDCNNPRYFVSYNLPPRHWEQVYANSQWFTYLRFKLADVDYNTDLPINSRIFGFIHPIDRRFVYEIELPDDVSSELLLFIDSLADFGVIPAIPSEFKRFHTSQLLTYIKTIDSADETYSFKVEQQRIAAERLQLEKERLPIERERVQIEKQKIISQNTASINEANLAIEKFNKEQEVRELFKQHGVTDESDLSAQLKRTQYDLRVIEESIAKMTAEERSQALQNKSMLTTQLRKLIELSNALRNMGFPSSVI